MGETKRDKNADAGKKVHPFVWFCEECKRVVRFLCDWVFYWWI